MNAPQKPLALTTTRHDGWTTSRQASFLRALASSHSVAEAARHAGMSRQSAYALRARLKGEPFDLAWHAALRCRFDALAEAALERALNGVEIPHFYKGELVGTSRRYDERLTVALLMMRDGFLPRRVRASHPASDYEPDDFGALVDRVEQGPETWAEEEQGCDYDRDYEEDDWREKWLRKGATMTEDDDLAS